jgi:hypothetical protein
MKSVSAKVVYKKRASRLELLIRFFWVFLAEVVLIVFIVLAAALTAFQWLYILFTGKRSKSIQGFVKSVVFQRFYIASYATLLTDERPPIVPKMERA